jgi:hypothetical protein
VITGLVLTVVFAAALAGFIAAPVQTTITLGFAGLIWAVCDAFQKTVQALAERDREIARLQRILTNLNVDLENKNEPS